MNKIEIGFDIATSITIIGAALSFLYSQRKSRRLSEVQYAVTNLQGFLAYVRGAAKEFDDLGQALRVQMSKLADMDEMKEKGKDMAQRHMFEVVLFLEGVESELDAQIDIYFPIFSPKGKAPKSLVHHKNTLNEIANSLRDLTTEGAGRLGEVDAALKDLEISVARELGSIVRLV